MLRRVPFAELVAELVVELGLALRQSNGQMLSLIGRLCG